MQMPAQTIVSEINAHMAKSGLPNAKWYVGITSSIDDRLFGFHQVPRKNHWYIFREAMSEQDARAIEAAYLNSGCKGGPGGGDAGSVFVYAYAVTPNTVE